MNGGEEGSARLVLAAFWINVFLAGGNGVGVRFSNRELDPVWGAGLRFLIAGSVLLAVMMLRRTPFPRGRALTGAVVFGLLQFGGAFGLLYFALVRLHAGLVQTLLALVPLATLLLAVAQRQERFRAATAVGSVLGLAGIGLISRDLLHGSVPVVSVLAVLGSVVCFAQAAVSIRRFPRIHPIVLNAVGMVVGATVLLVVSAVRGETFALPHRAATWLAVGYVALIGSIAVFWMYVYVIQRWGASRASYVMVLIPFVTVVLSAWLDHESLGIALVTGGILVLAGVYIGALHPSHEAARANRSAGDPG